MRVICSYCGILYNLKEPLNDDHESHGICDICWDWVQTNLKLEIEQRRGSHESIDQVVPET